MAVLQEEETYSIIELYNPENIGEVLRFQTFCEGFEKEYKQKMYSDYLCINFPFSPSKEKLNLDMKVNLPNISAREGSSFTRDWLLDNNQLRGWMIRIAWFRESDPNWVMDFVPWLVINTVIEMAKTEIRLSVPLKLVTQSSRLVGKHYTDQNTPHLPRVYA